ncbi:MAG: restriction endonuclease subunit S [Clostridium septicum]|uniref:restriction endonuclease subunit S n=1 Tax=Clostridium septicum TaxID=1504 RepID=UPI0029027DF1|nr:restriction endonuclease subunit S [Clostridium septicum]MDU1312482.1 restriction endonuclease subunit S [Clostridium septicum]
MDMMLEQFKTIFDRPERVKKLRETILDLAFKGKLLEQTQYKVSAEELLKLIKVENEELIAKGLYNKQRKIIDRIDAEKEYGSLPSGWRWCLLDDIVPYITDYQANGSFSSLKQNVKTFYEEEYSILVRLKDLRLSIKNNDLLYTDKEGYEFLAKSHLYGGELLVANVGAGIGTCIEMPYIDKKASIAPNMFIVYPSKYINKRLFKYYTQSKLYKEEITKKSVATGQPKMNKNEFRSLTFALPPLEEQDKIVEKLDSLMFLCDNLEKGLKKKIYYGELSAKSVFNTVGNVSTVEELEETLKFILLNFKDLSLGDNAVKELKNCILQLAVQGKLVPQDPNDEPAEVLLGTIREEKERLIKERKLKREKPLVEINEEEKPFELPCGWSWIRLGDYCLLNPRNNVEDSLDTSFVPMKLINDGFDNKHSFESKKWKEIKSGFTHFAENDIVVAKITPCFENRKSCIMKSLINGVGAGTTELHVVRCFEHTILPEFILCVFKTENFINGGIQTYTGTAGQQRVKKDFINNLVVAIPPLEEQKRIVEKVDSLMILCDQLEKKIENQKDYSNKLMKSIIKDI